MRLGAGIVCCRRVRFDRPTRTARDDPEKWRGSELLRVRQGHFGYRMLRDTIARLKERGDL